MSTSDRLKEQIAAQTVISKLIKLRDYGLDGVVANPRADDFDEDCKLELIPIINDRIAALEVA